MKMEEKIEKKYEELRQRFGLPDFGIADKEFEVSAIEHEMFLLREIRKKITERISYFCEILESFLIPDSCMPNIYEYNAFNEHDRSQMLSLYKKLKFLEKQSIEASIDNNEEENAAFIKSAFGSWQEIKQAMKQFIKKAKDFWETDFPKKDIERYFG